MNYLESSLHYKVRKFMRYTRMYGLSRTWIKYKSYKHEYGILKGSTTNTLTNSNVVSVVGAGKYAFAVVAYYMKKHGKYALRYVYDSDHNRRDNLARYYKGNIALSFEDLLDKGGTKLLVITSNHYSHALYAIQAIERGINVHIEKPHAVTLDQLNELIKALRQNPEVKVNLGYNRPKSELAKMVKHYLSQQNGSLVINWFVAGHEIEPDHWYFDEQEGGRVLGNLVHWIDYTLELIGLENAFPIQIIPTRAESSDSNIVVSYVFGDGSIATILHLLSFLLRTNFGMSSKSWASIIYSLNIFVFSILFWLYHSKSNKTKKQMAESRGKILKIQIWGSWGSLMLQKTTFKTGIQGEKTRPHS